MNARYSIYNADSQLVNANTDKLDHENLGEVEYFGSLEVDGVEYTVEEWSEAGGRIAHEDYDLLALLLNHFGGKYTKQDGYTLRIADHGMKPMNNDRFENGKVLSVVVGFKHSDPTGQHFFFEGNENEKQIYVHPFSTLDEALTLTTI